MRLRNEAAAAGVLPLNFPVANAAVTTMSAAQVFVSLVLFTWTNADSFKHTH